MESTRQNQTGSYARYRLLSSVGGKLADALGVIIAIKTLAPADYGVIGTALGVMAVVGFINLAPEDILWRDLPKLGDNLAEHLSAYVWFWLMKFGVVAAVTATFCLLYGRAHHSWQVAAAAFAIAVCQQVLNASTLAEVPLFAGLRQHRGAFFVLGVRALWLALLVPNFWLRSLSYYLVALSVYAIVTALISAWLLRREFGVNFRVTRVDAWPKVRDAALDFTLWLHLAGRARVFLQRGDLAILGGLAVSLAALGQYTVVVNLVGFAMILPGVLENVAAVSFAHHPERRRQSRRTFVALATGLAAIQFAGGLLGGRVALRLLHVGDVEFGYRIFVVLLAGVSVFTLASPFLAYALCFRRMRSVFTRFFLPAAVSFVIGVWSAARLWGVSGAAIAHATVVAATGIAVIIYVLASREEPVVVSPGTAEAESAFQE